MSDYHFGMDYDMWLYPPVPWWDPDWDFDLPEPIEAANIEGTLLVNAEDAIEQVRRLQGENAQLWERLTHMELHECPACANVADLQEALDENAKLRRDIANTTLMLAGAWERCRMLRELVDDAYTLAFNCYHGVFDQEAFFRLREKFRESEIGG